MDLPKDTPEMKLVYCYAEAWNQLDLNIFAPHFSPLVTYTSQHVLEELHGREDVEDHLRKKMEMIRNSSEMQVRAEIGLCGDQSTSMVRIASATENRPCMLVQQGPSPEPMMSKRTKMEKIK